MDGLPKDDFKWFGEGFDGFPKRLPEDTVEYAIYILDTELNNAQVQLNEIRQAAVELTKTVLKDYIWQREGFKLELKQQDGATTQGKEPQPSPLGRWALVGRTNYGDSVDDEWLIVYILRELSKQFQDAWFRIYDTDGEFLLIEAANALPSWLNPEVAENRVWLHNGRIKIIPVGPLGSSVTNGHIASKELSLEHALDFLEKTPQDLTYSPAIEKEAFYRLRDHPKAITDVFHHSLVRIPRKLAYLLHRRPQLISPAIEAFYLRDPISMRTLHSADASSSKLHFPPKDFITTSVKFTRIGFAQLKSQRYVPPPFWESTIPKKGPVKTQSQAEIGIKLTCGFEMLMSDPQNKHKKPVQEIRFLLKDISSGKGKLPADAQIATWPKKDDSEDWLDIDFSSFENELAGQGKNNNGPGLPKGHTGFGDPTAQENLRKMVERFEAFLKDDEAGAEGAEFLDDMDFDDDEKENNDGETDSEEDRDVSFDEEQFARMMREMMGMPKDADGMDPVLNGQASAGAVRSKGKQVEEEVDESDESDDENEAAAIEKQMRLMEDELRGHGALNLNPPPPPSAGKGKGELTENGEAVLELGKGKGKAVAKFTEEENDDEDDEGGEVNIDYNLMKNMLEAFKGQAGMAGPAGTMMGMMGIHMPRDEDEKETGPSK